MRVARRMSTQVTLDRMFGTSKKHKTDADAAAAAEPITPGWQPVVQTAAAEPATESVSPKAVGDAASTTAAPTVTGAESKLFNFLLEPTWRELLAPEFRKPYMLKLEKTLATEKAQVFPPENQIFAALNATPLSAVRVCIIGQDPYHAPGQAMGLAFSVPRGVIVPSSLRNIYKELAANVPSFRAPSHGDLSTWAARGVLLLNTSLTVRRGDAGSHSKQGWETLTERIVELLSARRDPIVFMLWGKHAQDRAKKIAPYHHLLKSAHPSGLSASKGFFGNKHFSRCNELLRSMNVEPIDWSLPM